MVKSNFPGPNMDSVPSGTPSNIVRVPLETMDWGSRKGSVKAMNNAEGAKKIEHVGKGS